MKIRYITPSILENLKLIKESEKALVYSGIGKEEGSVFKFFKIKNGYTEEDKKNLEEKINSAKRVLSVPEILIPSYALYTETKKPTFIGCQMPKIKGPHFREYIVDENETLDLYKFADEFSNLESIISRGNKKGFVFPDIATLSNIMILPESTFYLKKNRKVFIDYEGIQVESYYASGISEGLNPYLLHLDKYYKDQRRKLYSKNLDYASLLHIYFRVVFHVNLSYIGRKSETSGQLYNLNDMFSLIKLTNYDLMEKTWKLFVPNVENEKVGDLFYTIAEQYKLKSYKQKDKEYRYLVKKR